MKIFLCVPPTGCFIRDERCQINNDSRVAEGRREPIQLLYLAGLLKKDGHTVQLKDYSVMRSNETAVLADVRAYAPECIYFESSQQTFADDVNFGAQLVSVVAKKTLFIVKAPFLNNAYVKKMQAAQLFSSSCDMYFVCRNSEVSVRRILADYAEKKPFPNIYGWIDGRLVFPAPEKEETVFDVSEYSVPPREYLDKYAYTRPDTGRPMAYVYTGRGCNHACIFCSAPIYLGAEVQIRSVASVVEEIKQCISQQGIYDFFFRTDSFTGDIQWVEDFCRTVQREKLPIRWGANSRVDAVSAGLLHMMKDAGCEIVGFGIESGNDEILRHIKKGITVADIERAVVLVKESGMKSFLHCIVGFPWDTRETIADTKRLILRLQPDFIEVNVPYPLQGTELFRYAHENDLFVSKDLSKHSHVKPILKTFMLDVDEVSRLRTNLLVSFYCRPMYIVKTFLRLRSFSVGANYVLWGLRFLRSVLLVGLKK